MYVRKGLIQLNEEEVNSCEEWLAKKVMDETNTFHGFIMERYMKVILNRKVHIQAKHGLLTGLFN